MTTVWLALVIASAAVLAYVLVGYPLLLKLIVAIRGPRAVVRSDITPHLSLVISAFNEADVIGAKLDNALGLDYPRDRLEIAVVSDASDDGTDDIVRAYAHQGVVLLRQPTRRGKTAGLNEAMPHLRGEIVVFSDANAMYEPNALRMLVRNFADPSVGCVTGEARYAGDGHDVASTGEGAYWSYEMLVKRLETATGSCVGGDGAIYAIRRHLWQPLPEDGINDFLNPLQIVAAGWRGVYEPEAVCYEETAGETGREYRRRVRIISRSWRAVFLAADVLKPWKVGFFAVCVISHKVLRWWSAVFVAGLAGGLLGLLIPVLLAAPPVILAVIGIATAGALLAPPLRRGLQIFGYFLVLNAASLVGLVKGSVGRVSGVWNPPRQEGDARRRTAIDIWTGGALLTTVAAMAWLGVELDARPTAARVVFWASLGLLAYVFAGYPIMLALARLRGGRPVIHDRAHQPSVCLVVAANDEEAVIGDKIDNSLALDYPHDRLRLIVASDGSTDRTDEIVAACRSPRVTLFACRHRRGKIATISEAVRGIDEDVIVFSDANAFLHRDAVTALVRNFADPEVGAVSGDVVLTGERAALATAEDLYYRYERWLQRVESDLGSMVGVDGALYAVRRALFHQPPTDTVLDDMAVPMAVVRQGHRVVFDAEALAYEHGARSAWEEFARKTRIVAGAVQFLRRGAAQIPWRSPQVVFSLFSHKVLRWLSPLLGGLFLVSCYALRSEWWAFSLIWWGTVGAIVLGALGCLHTLRRFAPIGLCYYFCMVHLAAATGMLRGVLGGQAVAWQRFPRTPVRPV